jgi:Cu(I)/Ag(I) efflux system membrane fusion protein
MKRYLWMAGLGAALILGALIGMFMAAPPSDSKPAGAPQAADPHADHGASAAPAPVYTCSMHPQIRLPEPGDCPICGMALIVANDGSGGGGGAASRIALSPAALALARIETVVAERRAADVDLRLTGRVSLDETRVATITAWLGGRIERMFVDATGTRVEKGDHLFELYSPELYVAQQELVEASRLATRLESLGGEASEGAQLAAEAARQKLRLWGLHDWQTKRVIKDRAPRRSVTIYAPIGGTVTTRSAVQGDYVQTGSPIYTIADLSQVWVVLDAHESDLQWIRYGQEVAIEADAWPGRPIEGTVSFIAPTLDPKTRTVPVRVSVQNTDEALKPGMFVRGRLSAPVVGHAGAGVQGLAGKWISPMHPEVVADGPGRCDVCGMPLVPAEKHWLVGPQLRGETVGELPLVIPITAPLRTGRRAVVFVELPDQPEPTYELREVRLGARAGDVVVVLDGLHEGERVVAEGAFKLDSALQIRGDTSLMTLPAEPAAHLAAHAPSAEVALAGAGEVPPEFSKAFDTAVARAARLTAALAADDLEAARGLAGPLAEAVAEAASKAPKPFEPAVTEAAESMHAATTLAALREGLGRFMDAVEPALRAYGGGLSRPWEMVRCPMARDGAGAVWLQEPGEVANPYFGASMLRCGNVELRGAPEGGAQ